MEKKTQNTQHKQETRRDHEEESSVLNNHNEDSSKHMSEPSQELLRSSLKAINNADDLLNSPELRKNSRKMNKEIQSLRRNDEKLKKDQYQMYSELQKEVFSEGNGKKRKERKELSITNQVSLFNSYQEELNSEVMCKSECGPVKCEVSRCQLI